MGQKWGDYDAAANQGPMHLGRKLILLFAGLGFFSLLIGIELGWFEETAQVAKEQFGPRASLEKYEWFKNASSQLDRKKADITVYESRVRAMQDTYKDVPRQNWPREDREQMNVWSSEVAGVKASYNDLAAEYNAQMAKFNWSYANTGELPKGADGPLPREFKPYVLQ